MQKCKFISKPIDCLFIYKCVFFFVSCHFKFSRFSRDIELFFDDEDPTDKWTRIATLEIKYPGSDTDIRQVLFSFCHQVPQCRFILPQPNTTILDRSLLFAGRRSGLKIRRVVLISANELSAHIGLLIYYLN